MTLGSLLDPFPNFKRSLVRALYAGNRIWYRGDRRFCPICENGFRKFLEAHDRDDRRCPYCASVERHRLLWLFLHEKTSLFTKPTRLLHMAPLEFWAKKLSACAEIDYVTGDLESPVAKYHFDVTQIPFETGSFDAVLCNHVLEHVPDDTAAMAELLRVLKPGGFAVLQVPLKEGPTFEDPTITDPAEREKHFGQFDHLRWYGDDYYDRLREVGFDVTPVDFVQEIEPADRERMRLPEHEVICFCTKP